MSELETTTPQTERMVPLCTPENQAELTVICSLLESEGIFYSVSNDFFGSLFAGTAIPLYNQKTILVRRSSRDLARDLLIGSYGEPQGDEERGYTFFEKLRVVVEGLFFGWVIPPSGSISNERWLGEPSAEPDDVAGRRQDNGGAS